MRDRRTNPETQRESSARMAVARIAERRRRLIKKHHQELDPRTGRPKR